MKRGMKKKTEKGLDEGFAGLPNTPQLYVVAGYVWV
jgi:hypothetical protein